MDWERDWKLNPLILIITELSKNWEEINVYKLANSLGDILLVEKVLDSTQGYFPMISDIS